VSALAAPLIGLRKGRQSGHTVVETLGERTIELVSRARVPDGCGGTPRADVAARHFDGIVVATP
jgi:hypothetical protein